MSKQDNVTPISNNTWIEHIEELSKQLDQSMLGYQKDFGKIFGEKR